MKRKGKSGKIRGYVHEYSNVRGTVIDIWSGDSFVCLHNTLTSVRAGGSPY